MFAIHFGGRQNLKFSVEFLVEDRAKCQGHNMYNIDGVFSRSSAAVDTTRH